MKKHRSYAAAALCLASACSSSDFREPPSTEVALAGKAAPAKRQQADTATPSEPDEGEAEAGASGEAGSAGHAGSAGEAKHADQTAAPDQATAGTAGKREAGKHEAGSGGQGKAAGGGGVGGEHAAPRVSCIHDGTCTELVAQTINAVDLLFMVDNSNSMAGEQASLRAQFPALISMLTSGKRTQDDPHPFVPVRDLHVGVVSSDMGIPGVQYGGCHADGGDDGRLKHQPPAGDATCASTYPEFLSYESAGMSDATKFAADFGCIANLGTGGCGFEQQLEAPLKALTAAMDPSISFLATTPEGTHGRGDVPLAMGGNQGFLHADGKSLIVIVAVTDEEDCSVRRTDHLWPANQLPESSPYRGEDINLRCFYHPDFLYDVKDRYYTHLRALRPGHEDLVVFTAIAGVPVDLVEPSALAKTDFSNPSARDDFYDRILGDDRMQLVPDPSTNVGMGTGNLTPSCSRTTSNQELSTAYPPRRMVELAKLFGENGMVQSICQDDFGPSMSAIVDVVAKRLVRESCELMPLERHNDKVRCDVIWELPPSAADVKLSACDQAPFLAPVSAPRSALNARGGNNCVVQQLAASNPSNGSAPAGEGWFYDDFTQEGASVCGRRDFRRIAFSAAARPPAGVKVKLDCEP